MGGGVEAWDPATTGGLASIGVLGYPLGPLLAWFVLVGLAIGAASLVRHGRSAGGPRTWLVAARGILRPGGRTSWRAIGVGLFLVWLPLSSLKLFLADWDPLAAADPSAPGPMVAEVLADGLWEDDSVANAGSYSWSLGDPCAMDCPGPRYLYRVAPGDRYWWLQTVRNDGPLPVTLLGWPAPAEDPPSIGLALLRDPTLLSAEAANLRAFEPVPLAPGATVTLAIVVRADACADPRGSRAWGEYMTAYPFVYEVLGWHREGDVWPHYSVTEAGCG